MIGSALESFHIQSTDSMKNVFEPFNNTVQKYKKLPQNFKICVIQANIFDFFSTFPTPI